MSSFAIALRAPCPIVELVKPTTQPLRKAAVLALALVLCHATLAVGNAAHKQATPGRLFAALTVCTGPIDSDGSRADTPQNLALACVVEQVCPPPLHTHQQARSTICVCVCARARAHMCVGRLGLTCWLSLLRAPRLGLLAPRCLSIPRLTQARTQRRTGLCSEWPWTCDACSEVWPLQLQDVRAL